MVRVRDDTSNYSDDGKRIDFKMGVVLSNFGGSDSDKGIVFFIDI